MSGGDATAAVARQMVALGEASTQREAEDDVRRIGLRAGRELFGMSPSRSS